MKKLSLFLCLVAVAGCTHFIGSGSSCYQKVAISETAITSAYQRLVTLTGSDLIDMEDARSAYKGIKIADTFSNQAAGLCALDEAGAADYIEKSSTALIEALKFLGE